MIPDASRPMLKAIFAQPDNAGVLRHIGLRSPSDVTIFEAGTDGSPFDEGGMLFFHDYGRSVPAAARCSLHGTVLRRPGRPRGGRRLPGGLRTCG